MASTYLEEFPQDSGALLQRSVPVQPQKCKKNVGIPFLLLAKGMRLNTVVQAIIFIQIYFYDSKFLKSPISADVTPSNISAVL